MQTPACIPMKLFRQFLLVPAVVALIAVSGCNNTKTAVIALGVTSSHSGSFAVGEQNAQYTLTVTDSGTEATNGTTVTVTDTVPTGMTLVSMAGPGWTCATNSCTRTDVLAASASYPTITVTVNVALNATSPESNNASVSGGGATSANAPADSTVVLIPSLSIASSHSGSFSVGQQGTYSLTISNAAGTTATLGTVTATDTLPSGMTLISMSGTGWTCAANSCTRSDALNPGSSYPVITVTANVNLNATSPESNNANVSGGDSAAANSPADATTVLIPSLSIASAHSGNFSVGQQGTYTLTVSNAAGAATTVGPNAVTATENVPAGMTLVSMVGNGAGWTCVANVCTESNTLAGGASYPTITVTVNVTETTPTTPLSNTASVAGGDSAGANSVADSTTILFPSLSIASTHVGSFVQGQQGTYTLTVSNAAGANVAATTGTVTATDTVPVAGMTLATMSGTGWTCTVLPTCTRSDALAPGASYPTITVTVNVSGTAPTPETNQVSVADGLLSTNTGNDPTTILTPTTLSILKTHIGNFSQGQQNAQYTVTVSNAAGAAPTSGTVTVTETVPAGETLVSMSGTNWNCTVPPTCTRSDALAGGSSYPVITVTVNVASTATSPQVNMVAVSGGGSSPSSVNDSTTIVAPALTIIKTPVGSFFQGEQGAQYTVTVSNGAGAGTTSGTVTVTEIPPADGGETLVSMAGTGWTCTTLPTCTRSDSLAGGSSYPAITVTVNVSLTANAIETNSVQATGGNFTGTATGPAPTAILVPSLSITKTPNGTFTQGEAGAQYTVTVSNAAGAGTTVGTVTVVDTPPTGETITAMAGTGWTCTTLPTCTTTNTIAGGASFPSITVTVTVAGNATSPQTNSVQVSGGNSASANASIATTIGAANPCAGMPTGNEALFAGNYAFYAQGHQGSGNGTPVAVAGSFLADGSGHLVANGTGVSGHVTINNASGPEVFTIAGAGGTGLFLKSFYTLGPDSTGAGNIGCVALLNGNGGAPIAAFTFSVGRLGTVGGVANQVYTQGRVIEFDDASGTGTRVSGLLRTQDLSAFDVPTPNLSANYAIGLDGQDSTGGHIAIAGSFATNVSTNGPFTNVTVDIDDAGTVPVGPLTGSGGILSSVDNQDGRATFTFTAGGIPFSGDAYIVNSNEIFIVSTGSYAGGIPIVSGLAIASSASYTALPTAMIIHTTGQNSCSGTPCAVVALGLVMPSAGTTATGTTSGTFTGDIYNYNVGNGVSIDNFPSGSPGTYSLTDATGRVQLGNAGNHPPVFYLASPQANTEPFLAFFVGSDSSAVSGFGEQGATSSITTASLAGKYFFGGEDMGDNTVQNQIGVVAVSATGVLSGTQNSSGQSGLQLLQPVTGGPVTMTNQDPSGNTAFGTGNIGTGTVAITNGTRFFFIIESGAAVIVISGN